MDLIEDMLEKLLNIQKSYQDLESQNIRLISEMNVLRQQMEHAKAREQGYLEQLRSLSNTIQELESDRRNILLKKQIEPTMGHKTIKGRTYYINDDHEVFERLYDGGVGNKVGDIKFRDDGKTVVCWI